MANKNSNLHAAKKAKCDEFYTQLTDIEKELCHYKEQFRDKVVYCNCDDARHSNFFKFFSLNFEHYGLKKLITTSFNANGKGTILIYEGDKNGNRMVDDEEIQVQELNGNGDFRSEECIELLKQADIVVTNPPFSLFREYVAQLVQYGKKFLIVGHQNAITYKEIFPLIKDGLLWLGHGFKGDVAHFVSIYEDTAKANDHIDGMIRVSGVKWFTNLPYNKSNEMVCLIQTYNEKDYPKFDNYDAINVNKTKDIPYDYEGVIGVPITALKHLHFDGLLHFEAPLKKKRMCTESSNSDTETTTRTCQSTARHHTSESSYSKYRIIDANDCHRQGKRKSTMLVKDADSAINGKPTYARILIQRV